MQVLVVIPTYNERENLPVIVGRLRAAVPAADVLVVDDDSPDGTGELADGWPPPTSTCTCCTGPASAGSGAAYLARLRAGGWTAGYDVLVEMDADGSHPPEQLPGLLERVAAGADLVIGSRWVPGGRGASTGRARARLLSRGGNLYARLALGIGLRDATGGFRAYRREALEKLDLGRRASQGYCFQMDLAWRAVRRGLRVVEVPITFVERELGRQQDEPGDRRARRSGG